MVLFLNPNNYKHEANDLLKKHTGLNFEITGPINWSLWPLSFDLQNVTLASPAIEIKSTKLVLDPYTIFGNHLVIESLEINGLSAEMSRVIPLTALNSVSNVTINLATIQAATFIFKDATQDWELKNSSVNAQHILLGTNPSIDPITVNGTLTNRANNNASFDINTTVAIDLSKQTLSLDPFNLTWNEAKAHGKALFDQNPANESISGDIIIEPVDLDDILKRLDPYYTNSDTTISNVMKAKMSYSYSMANKMLDLNKIDLNLDDGNLNGNLKFTMSAPYSSEFNLSSDKLNLAPLFTLGKALFPSIPSNEILPIDVAKTISIIGKVSGSNIIIDKDFVIDNLNADINAQDGLIQINPLTFGTYGGNHSMSIYIDANKPMPFFKVTDHAQGISLEPWMKLIKHAPLIDGTGNLKVSLDAMGNTLSSLQQSLNGNVSLELSKGTLYGIDITKLMSYVAATMDDVFEQLATSKNISLSDLLKPKMNKWSETQKNNPLTNFDTFTFKSDITQSVAKSSFALDNANYDFNGNGEFKIFGDELNFQAALTVKADTGSKVDSIDSLIKLMPLNILVSGNFNHILYNPNLESYATDLLKQANDNLIKVAASSMVAASPANDKTSKTADELFIDSLKALAR